MNIFAVTAIEGSLWIPWDAWQRLPVPDIHGKRVHAILFDDGRVWDASNGFRSGELAIGKYSREAILETWKEVSRLKEPTARQRMLMDDVRRLETVVGPLFP